MAERGVRPKQLRRVTTVPEPADLGFIEIDGRKWRRSDPSIPSELSRELVHELMAARRAVAAARVPRARQLARRRVQDAKVALGERGRAWWLPASADAQHVRIDASIRALLRSRRAGATICPSEPARIVGADRWRSLLTMVREQAAQLAERGEIDVLRKRRVVTRDRHSGVLRYRLREPTSPSRTRSSTRTRLDP